MNQPFKEIVLN